MGSKPKKTNNRGGKIGNKGRAGKRTAADKQKHQQAALTHQAKKITGLACGLLNSAHVPAPVQPRVGPVEQGLGRLKWLASRDDVPGRVTIHPLHPEDVWASWERKLRRCLRK